MSRSDDKRLIDEQPWLQQAVDDLRRPVSPEVAGQLRAARRTALEQVKQDREKPYSGWSLFAGWQAVAIAGIGAMVIGWVLLPDFQSLSVSNHTASVVKEQAGQMILEDLSIMTSQDDLQFYQDLELLRWLESEGDADVQG